MSKEEITRYKEARYNYIPDSEKDSPKPHHISREYAAEALNMSPEKLEKIENRKLKSIDPYDIVDLAKFYHDNTLCKYYCTHDCEIGKYLKIKEAQNKDIHEITTQTLAILNKLNRQHNNLIDITADGAVDETEREQFEQIKIALDEMSEIIDSMKLWCDKNLK